MINRIAFIGNYLPRQCGIATFTADLCESIAAQSPETTCMVLAVNEGESQHAYPSRVRFELTEKDLESYHRAADFLNLNSVDLVCLQHEYGIYGGQAGAHILALLGDLHMPVVTTLHTVLENPDPDQRNVLERVASLSDRVVVMSAHGVKLLKEVYGIPAEKIDFIPHGIPDVPFADPDVYKELFGIRGKTVLLSFGLLSADKGIENVIAALPDVLARHPELVYIILGATHPHVKRHEGETYRLSLQRLAREKGVEGSVIFHNRFVTLKELNSFIGATDIYITPYLKAAQITSGTLAYTVGAGKAVISTPYWYAQEILADGRGVLVPFGDPAAIGREVVGLLDDELKRNTLRHKAYRFGREMIWSNVADRYLESFALAREQREQRRPPAPGFKVRPLNKWDGDWPPLKLDHLRRMTDATGILQHAVYTVPNYQEGYTTDDNARALMVSALLDELGNKGAYDLTSRYLAFLFYAFNVETGRFRNFMNYQRRWLEESGSDDCHGRALCALGMLMGHSHAAVFHGMAERLFTQGLPGILNTTSPRGWAFALIGMHECLPRLADPLRAREIREELAGRLLRMYRIHRSNEWQWFEGSLTYCNAVLPHALLLCAEAMPDSNLTGIGLESLDWLARLHRLDAENGHFIPIGSNGFYPRGGERSRFDQQPVEIQAMVSACLGAYRITGDKSWRHEARRAFEWFLGRNDLNLPLYDPTTGGCRDGLHADRLNQNQGAESSLAFLQALLELRLSENTFSSLEVRVHEPPVSRILQAS